MTFHHLIALQIRMNSEGFKPWSMLFQLYSDGQFMDSGGNKSANRKPSSFINKTDKLLTMTKWDTNPGSERCCDP